MRVSAQITLCVSSPWLVCCLQSWSWTTRFPIQWLRSSRPLCFVWQWCTEDSLSRIHGSENTGLACSIWLEIGIKSKIFSKTPTCGMRPKIVALKMDPCVMQWNSSGMPLGRWSPAASLLNLFPLIYCELRSPGILWCTVVSTTKEVWHTSQSSCWDWQDRHHFQNPVSWFRAETGRYHGQDSAAMADPKKFHKLAGVHVLHQWLSSFAWAPLQCHRCCKHGECLGLAWHHAALSGEGNFAEIGFGSCSDRPFCLEGRRSLHGGKLSSSWCSRDGRIEVYVERSSGQVCVFRDGFVDPNAVSFVQMNWKVLHDVLHEWIFFSASLKRWAFNSQNRRGLGASEVTSESVLFTGPLIQLETFVHQHQGVESVKILGYVLCSFLI